MLALDIVGTFNYCGALLASNPLNEATCGKLAPINHLSNAITCARKGPHCNGIYSVSFLQEYCPYSKIHQSSLQNSSKRWLCRSQDSVSADDEYRSSRNIAISLFRRYRNYVERGVGDTLKEFIGAGVNAYALGCTDYGLRRELIELEQSGAITQVLQAYGGNTSLKSKILPHEVDECILWVSIIFITILCTPQPTIVRWSSTSAVSEEMIVQWKGFCAIIANAYYMRGMAWLPVKTLQLEQLAVAGRAEEPSLVASRMRLVFSTLEVVSPQWPRV